ncbi:MAG: ABC transporter substrate-binding protein [Polyangiaceae bacterium]|nr:ABC transporter substrate-binding protein [Polyangiaceae bacterium]
MSRAALAAGAFVAGALLGGCGDDDGEKASAAPSPFLEFGAVLSLSGSGRDTGVAEQQGIRAAERHVNALGGVLGRPIRVTIVDDGSDPVATNAAALGLLERTLPLIIGPTGSDGAAALADIIAAQRAVVISSSATALGAGEPAGGSFFFRLTPSDAVQGRALRLLAASRTPGTATQRCASAAVVFSDDLYGKPIAAQFDAGFRQSFGQVLASVPVPTDLQPDATYVGVAATVARSGAECQLVVTRPDVAASYLRAFQEAKALTPNRDWSTFLTIGGDALYTASFLVLSREDPARPDSPSAAEGVFIVAPDATPGGPAYNAFRQVYQAQNPGEPPPPFSANAFDAVVLAALAIEQAGGDLSAVAIREGLLRVSAAGRAYDASSLVDAVQDLRRGRRINYASASGTTNVSANGEVFSDFIVSPVVSGQFQTPVLRFSASELQ